MTIKLHIKSLDTITLNLYLTFIKKTLKIAQTTNLVVQKMPKKKKRVSLLKSPHVNKKAYEQFELSVFKATVFLKRIKLYFLRFLILNKPKHINVRIVKIK